MSDIAFLAFVLVVSFFIVRVAYSSFQAALRHDWHDLAVRSIHLLGLAFVLGLSYAVVPA